MSKRTKYTAEEKHQILTEYADGTSSIKEVTTKFGISSDTFKKAEEGKKQDGHDEY